MENLQLYYDYEVTKGGKILEKLPKTECHSFVQGFAGILCTIIGQVRTTITDMDNVAQTGSGAAASSSQLMLADAGMTYRGCIIGTGTAAVAVTDYALGTQIDHGTGAGELQYAASVVNSPSYDATKFWFVCSRVFSNNSGGSITAEEVGLLMYSSYFSIIGGYKGICIARDLSSIVVANGASLSLNYTLEAAI